MNMLGDNHEWRAKRREPYFPPWEKVEPWITVIAGWNQRSNTPHGFIFDEKNKCPNQK